MSDGSRRAAAARAVLSAGPAASLGVAIYVRVGHHCNHFHVVVMVADEMKVGDLPPKLSHPGNSGASMMTPASSPVVSIWG